MCGQGDACPDRTARPRLRPAFVSMQRVRLRRNNSGQFPDRGVWARPGAPHLPLSHAGVSHGGARAWQSCAWVPGLDQESRSIPREWRPNGSSWPTTIWRLVVPSAVNDPQLRFRRGDVLRQQKPIPGETEPSLFIGWIDQPCRLPAAICCGASVDFCGTHGTHSTRRSGTRAAGFRSVRQPAYVCVKPSLMRQSASVARPSDKPSLHRSHEADAQGLPLSERHNSYKMRNYPFDIGKG